MTQTLLGPEVADTSILPRQLIDLLSAQLASVRPPPSDGSAIVSAEGGTIIEKLYAETEAAKRASTSLTDDPPTNEPKRQKADTPSASLPAASSGSSR